MIKLRRAGEKRPRDEVRAAASTRGELSVYVYRGVRSAFLHPAGGRGDPLVLEACVLTRMRGASFIVAGVEVRHYRGEEHREEQAWWCRLPAGAEDAPLDLSPVLSREEKRAVRAERS